MQDFNDGVDGMQASRLRTVNSEQFQTLVKMHLSFELDRNTEDNDCIIEKAKIKKWGLPSFSKKPKSTMNLQKGHECAALTQEGISQVQSLIEYLSQEQCIMQEGIFRRTGKLTRQQDLKTALYHGLPLDLSAGRFSVHDCASVLKGFLADLPEPLLTDLHYPVHCQIAELCSNETNANDARLLRALQLLLLLLPPLNRILLKHVLNLLNKTASFEANNKMNCDTIATLFTPHLMCPRKLSPEALHINSQNLSGIVAFMIKKGLELFEIPPKLAMDIRAYWVEQERKLLSPRKADLNESISDTTGTARTVFSFVDHQLTAQATASQDTQAALAQLYAYIQSMPESAKKRKLVKQFNKENGQGTPRHVKHVRTKSLGDSIKKHIFQKKLLGHKKLTDLKIGCNFSRSSSEENILSTENIMTPRSRKPVVMSSVTNICNLSTLHSDSIQCHPSSHLRGFNTDSMFRKGCTSIREESTVSSDNCYDEVHVQNKENVRADLQNDQKFVISPEYDGISSVQKSSSITSTFKDYLLSRSVLTASPVDLSFASRTGDFEPSESDLNILNEDALSDSLLNCLDGNNPGSDTSGIASGSTNSADNSSEKMEEVTSPRKRGTSLQRNDSKRAIKNKNTFSNSKNQVLMHKQLSDSTLNSLRSNEVPPETAF